LARFEPATCNPLKSGRKGLHLIDLRFTLIQMENKLTGRGGPGRGQGRKPKDHSDAMKMVGVRMTDAQKEKLGKLGGAPWVRDKIDKAKLPKE
jgi:hypothetical protein